MFEESFHQKKRSQQKKNPRIQSSFFSVCMCVNFTKSKSKKKFISLNFSHQLFSVYVYSVMRKILTFCCCCCCCSMRFCFLDFQVLLQSALIRQIQVIFFTKFYYYQHYYFHFLFRFLYISNCQSDGIENFYIFTQHYKITDLLYSGNSLFHMTFKIDFCCCCFFVAFDLLSHKFDWIQFH